MESLWLQSPEIQTYFSLLSGTERGLSWRKETLPLLFGYSNRTKPYDVPFDKVRENILNLDYDLANAVLRFELRVYEANRMLTDATQTFSSQSRVDRDEMLKDLEDHKNMYKEVAESVRLLARAANNTRKQLFEGKRKIVVDWSLVDAKSLEIDKLLLKAAGVQND